MNCQGFLSPTTFTTSKGVRLVYQMRTHGPTVRAGGLCNPCTPRAQQRRHTSALNGGRIAYPVSCQYQRERTGLLRVASSSDSADATVLRRGAEWARRRHAICRAVSSSQRTPPFLVGTQRSSHENLDRAHFQALLVDRRNVGDSDVFYDDINSTLAENEAQARSRFELLLS